MSESGTNDLRSFTPILRGNSAEGESNRILVVDDEEIVLSVLRDALRRQNYEVVATTQPTLALEELQKNLFAVVIADQRMPVITGLELLEQAREIQPAATRILIAAVVSLDTVLDAINHGLIYRFIVKPWLREELLGTVQNAVQLHQLIQRNLGLQTTTQTLNGRILELTGMLEEQMKLAARQNQQLLQMHQTLEQHLLRAMELSLRAAQTFYPALGQQSRRAAQLCRLMGQMLNLPPEERRALENAALLHDIGLIATPRSLIRRWQENPTSLNADERALIEQHPILGQELSAFSSAMDPVGALIRVHHERMDGAGYPDRLTGDKIPWLGRLLAVAVAFASSKLVRDDAVEEIKMQANSALDADAIRVFLRVVPLAHAPRKERQIQLSELRPGMVLARGISAPNGLLLAPEGQQLNFTYIEKILNHNRIQPIDQSLVVYC